VSIGPPASADSDGFTVLPNGNFLINNADTSCTYNQYNPSTGAVISGTTITVAGTICSGVDTNGTSLYFQTNLNSFTKTDLSGGGPITKSVTSPFSCVAAVVNCVEDISLVTFGARGQPGKPNCQGKTVSDLATTYRTIANAASPLGYASASALQKAITSFCASP
jgi:hypothetical protein